MASWKPVATKRLLWDLKEVLEHPLADVVALPDEEDLFTWHGNVRGEADSPLTDVPFHFRLDFPQDYPNNPPKVALYTKLPHPNVVREKNRWRLSIWDCNPEEVQWSCAYTVHSILIQLQAYLLSQEMLTTQQETLPLAIEQALKLKLKDHPHTGAAPVPAFHTQAELEAAAGRARRRKTVVAAPSARKRILPFNELPVVAPATPSPAKKVKKVELKGGKALPVVAAPAVAAAAQAAKEDDAWQVVKGKGAGKGKPGPSSPSQPSSAAKPAATAASTSNPFSHLTKKASKLLVKAEKQGEAIPPQTPPQMPPATGAGSGTTASTSKAAKKNAKRRAKKQGPQPTAPSTPPPTNEPSTQQFFTPASSVMSVPSTTSEWKEVPKKAGPAVAQAVPQAGQLPEVKAAKVEKTVAELIREVMEASKAEAASEQYSMEPWSVDLARPAGLFSFLPPDIMTTLYSLLDRKSIAMLASTCKSLKASCTEGEVWRLLLARDYAGAQVTATRSSDWKHAYLLQSHNVVGELKCYFTKATHEEQVLGMPASFTVNPRTGEVDYIAVQTEGGLLALSAFKQGVRRGPGRGEADIQVVIPAYLCEEHFQRALPLLPGILKVLTPQERVNRVSPVFWLVACAKMLNTAVVLLIDEGVKASEKAINMYSWVHRLLLALAEHYNLWEEAARRLDSFLSTPSARTKVAVPNLGLLICLLAVSPRHKWGQLAVPLLVEVLDRQVLWVCKAKPSLAASYAIPEVKGGVDQELVDGAFESSQVSRGLLAFHSAFLHFVARPPNVSIDQVMTQSDSLYGRASEAQIRRMQAAIRKIQAASTWSQFFGLLGVRRDAASASLSVDAFATKLLRRAWQNSLKKRYHSKFMDFSLVQASGVSNILLRGQRYTAPPNMKRMEIVNVWRWDEDIKYLDQGILLFGARGHICNVDWNRQRSIGTRIMGAVSHSGDILDVEQHLGKQITTIWLNDLGDHVEEIYIAAAAYSHHCLADIIQPHSLIRDASVNNNTMTLCQFHPEDVDARQLMECSCIVMCRIYKEGRSWKVEALGDFLAGCFMGDDGDYAPIISHIEERRAQAAGGRV